MPPNPSFKRTRLRRVRLSQTLGHMKTIAKFIALFPLAVVLFLGNAYGSMSFAALLFPRVVPRPFTEMISAATVGAIVGGILVAYPLAKLFPSRHWAAALLVSSPLVALRLSDLHSSAGTAETANIIMSAVELLLVPMGAVMVTWLFARFFPRVLPNVA